MRGGGVVWLIAAVAGASLPASATAEVLRIGQTIMLWRPLLCDGDGPCAVAEARIPRVYQLEQVFGMYSRVVAGDHGGWVRSEDLITGDFERALESRIGNGPRGAAWCYLSRAAYRVSEREAGRALDDADRSIALDPTSAPAYYLRGLAHLLDGRLDRADADLTRALELEPKLVSARIALGDARCALRDFQGALADYTEAIRLNPRSSAAYGRRAALRAACPEARYRDVEAAVADATRACEVTAWRSAPPLVLLAAVRAEAGDLRAAVRWQSRAASLRYFNTPSPGDEADRLRRYRTRLWSWQAREIELAELPDAWGPPRFTPDGRSMLTGSRDGLRLWDTAAWAACANLDFPDADVADAVFSDDGTSLAVADRAGRLAVWSTGAGCRLATVRPDGRFVRPLAFSPDGRRLATLSLDLPESDDPVVARQAVQFWDAGSGRPVAVATANEAEAVLGRDSGVRIEVVAGRVRTYLPVSTLPWLPESRGPAPFAIAADSRRYARAAIEAGRYGSRPGDRILLGDRGRPARAILEGHRAGVEHLAFAPDGKLLASADLEGVVKLWDPSAGQERASLDPSGGLPRIDSIAFSPDGRALVVGLANRSDEGSIRGPARIVIWDVARMLRVAATDEPDLPPPDPYAERSALARRKLPDSLGRGLLRGFP